MSQMAKVAKTTRIRIAIDAMGGDFGPRVVIPGAAIALEHRPDTFFIFFGDSKVIVPLVDANPKLKAASLVHHSDVAIQMTDKPSHALRTGRKVSSMWMALEAIKRGEADVAISAGNTGALMAMSKFCLRTMPQIDRPAIAAMWPTMRGESIVLDVGATIGADAQHLVDLAIMGAAMAQIVFDIDRPSVGLLNVGVEEIKGLEEIKAAGRTLRETDMPNLAYHGFVEGDDIGRGTVDVVVTEGYTGNIALKTAEGTARQLGQFLREAMSSSLLAKLGYLLARGAFNAVREKMDPRKVNGGVFLGLDGIVIKSHGGTDAIGFAGAVEVGYEMVKHGLLGKIRDSLAQAQEEHFVFSPKPALRSVVMGIGSALPANCVTNAELEQRVDTSDEWIVQRTGIRQRYIAGPDETTSVLATRAARAALDDAGLKAEDIDLLIVATSTPDYTFPATATMVQAALGMTQGVAFDMQAVCSGFVFAVSTADKFLASGSHRRALVIGAETFSRILDWKDRTTCVLFGDGAGAMVLEAQPITGVANERGILSSHLRSDGRHRAKLFVDGGPSTTQTVGHLRMEGRDVFRHAVGMVTDVIHDAFNATGLTAEDLDWFVPHQANRRIIDASAEKLSIAPEKVVTTVQLHGNTSAASIPLALCVAKADGRIKTGDLVMIEAMGGGFTWGSALIRW
eukprot:gene13805-13921_t